MLLYIHGFRTTINSPKAVKLKKHYKDDIFISNHPYEPKKAVAYLEKIIKQKKITGIIASSIGGFYATYLSEKFDLKTVLINPSVKPYLTTTRYIGLNKNFDGKEFLWKKKHLLELEKLKVQKLKVQNYYIFLQTGDKVIDYKIAKKRYQGAKLLIEKGGEHKFIKFKRFYTDVSDFLK